MQRCRILGVKHVEFNRDGPSAAGAQHADDIGMTRVCDGLCRNTPMALCSTLEQDMVEADDGNPLGRARRRHQLRHSIDSEVRPLRLLDLEKETHVLALGPIEDLR